MSINESDPVVGQIGAKEPVEVGIAMALREVLDPLKVDLREHGVRNLNISVGETFTTTSLVMANGKTLVIIESINTLDGSMSEHSYY